MNRWALLAAGSALVLTACDPGFVLLLDLRSDLVPGIEVDSALVQVETDEGTREAVVPITRDAPLLEGVRVGEFTGVAAGDQLIQVFLREGEQTVAERAVVNVQEADQVITILITRDCRDVMCGDPAGETCLGGRCGSSQCTPETPSFCEPECASDADCTGGSACSAARCVTGLCVEAPDEAGCGDGEYCDPDSGCRPLPELDPCLMNPDAPDHRTAGNGTEADPHVLCNGGQLASLAEATADWGLHYRLGADLDAVALTRTIADGAAFTGSLDGNGHQIRNLGVPLLGNLEGDVRNLRLDGEVELTTETVGLLAETATGGEVRGVAVSGAVRGTDRVGLLIGWATNVTLTDCTAELTGEVRAETRVGGMIGEATSCTAQALSVSGREGTEGSVGATADEAGGLYGRMSGGELTRGSAAVDVTGNAEVGGLIGMTSAVTVIRESTASGDVRGEAPTTCTYAGGLVGRASNAQIARSYATGFVQAVGAVAGGLVGWVDDGTIEDSYATGDTVAGPNGADDCSTVDAQIYTGGLVAVSIRADLLRCWASGEAGGTGPVRGGLLSLGFTSADVTQSFSVGAVGTGTDTGGLVGVMDGMCTVADSTWDAASAGNTRLCGRGGAAQGCDDQPGVDSDADYFFDPSNPPMREWDFDTVWQAVPGALPRLRWQGA